MSVSGGQVHITGNGTWGNHIINAPTIQDGEGIRVLFKLTGSNPASTIYLSSGTWAQSSYRRWGFLIQGGKINWNIYEGTAYQTGELMNLETDVWYEAQLVVDGQTNGFHAVIWKRDNPSVSSSHTQAPSTTWAGLNWQFYSQVNTGSSDIESYTEFLASDNGQLANVKWGPNPSQNLDAFYYDRLGRMNKQVRTLDNRPYTMETLSFDSLNRPLTVKYPNNEVITYTYDREGENTLRAGSDLLVDNLTYNARGQMTRLERPNNLDTVFSYYGATGTSGTGNSNFRLSNVTAGSLINLNYTYDKVGNIKTIGDNLIGNTQSFGYDDLNRLITASAPAAGSAPAYNHTYAYNQIGNMTSYAGTAYAYNDAAHKHAVTHLGGVQKFWYDANGNMTKRIEGSVTYDPQVYDAENRLISVTKIGTGTTTFAYDASGQRVKTVQPNGVTTYTPFPNYEEEVNGSTTTRRTTYAVTGQAVAIRVQIVGGSSTLYYLFNDHLGSTSVLSNSGGVKISGSEARYLPFGAYRTTPTTNPSVTDRGFTGHKHNDSLGLIYYNARFYSPYLNRFISADTIVPDAKDPQSLNRYAYVRNNPLKYVDPSGHCWGFASGLRNTFYQTTCENIDQAISIIQHPDASVGEKALAVGYVGAEALAHGTVAVGSGVAAVGCLTGAGTTVCAGAGSAVTAAAADGDPTNEAAAVANGVSNAVQAVSADGNPFNEAQTVLSVTDKLQRYLLNLNHPDGGTKARWFKEALGFTRENQADLAKQIIFNESTAIQTAVTEYGTKFNQTITITGANGKTIDVVFAWIRNNDGIVRLVTAIPTQQ